MARTAATPEQRAEVRRKIRHAAASIYAEGGLSALSARAIAVRAGVSVGTLYSYYANLTDLMRSLWTPAVQEAQAQLRTLSETHPDPERRLEAILAFYVDFAAKNREVYKGVFLFVRPDAAPKDENPPVGPQAFHNILCAAIRDGQKTGVFRKGDADRMAHLVWAGIHGALALPINFDLMDFGPPGRLPGDMITALIASIKA